MRIVFVLHGDSQAKALFTFLRLNRKAKAAEGKPLTVTVSEYKDKRHNEQNKLYWATLNEIATQAMIDGKQYSKDGWHYHFAGEFIGWEEAPGGRRIPISTTTLSVSEFAEYVTKVMAFAASELGVIFPDVRG